MTDSIGLESILDILRNLPRRIIFVIKSHKQTVQAYNYQ
jgi:hypothetical protein